MCGGGSHIRTTNRRKKKKGLQPVSFHFGVFVAFLVSFSLAVLAGYLLVTKTY